MDSLVHDDVLKHIVLPFKIDDYILGVKYAFNSAAKVPHLIFARKSFDVQDGKVTVDADFDLSAEKTVFLASKWKSLQHGFTLGAAIDTGVKNLLTGIHFQKDNFKIKGKKASIYTAFNFLSKKLSGVATVQSGDLKALLQFHGATPTIGITKALDSRNEITPMVNLKTGKPTLILLRRWGGGSLKSTLQEEKASFEWRDDGVGGAWITTASVPINNDNPSARTKVSISREWFY